MAMTKLEFEAEVADFCKLYLCEYVDDYQVGYNEYEDGEIEAYVHIEIGANRDYNLKLIPHPDRDGDIAIPTYEDSYVEADGAGLYLWLWVETLNRETRLMEKAGLMRMGDGSVTAKYYVEDGRHVWLSLDEWHEKRKRAARQLGKAGMAVYD